MGLDGKGGLWVCFQSNQNEIFLWVVPFSFFPPFKMKKMGVKGGMLLSNRLLPFFVFL